MKKIDTTILSELFNHEGQPNANMLIGGIMAEHTRIMTRHAIASASLGKKVLMITSDISSVQVNNTIEWAAGEETNLNGLEWFSAVGDKFCTAELYRPTFGDIFSMIASTSSLPKVIYVCHEAVIGMLEEDTRNRNTALHPNTKGVDLVLRRLRQLADMIGSDLWVSVPKIQGKSYPQLPQYRGFNIFRVEGMLGSTGNASESTLVSYKSRIDGTNKEVVIGTGKSQCMYHEYNEDAYGEVTDILKEMINSNGSKEERIDIFEQAIMVAKAGGVIR